MKETEINIEKISREKRRMRGIEVR